LIGSFLQILTGKNFLRFSQQSALAEPAIAHGAIPQTGGSLFPIAAAMLGCACGVLNSGTGNESRLRCAYEEEVNGQQ
jgi:hypothetical protein